MSDIRPVLRRFQPSLDPAHLIPTTSIGHQLVFIVIRIHEPSQLKLFAVAHTFDSLRLRLGLRQCRKKHPRKDRNDRDHNQQFNKCKSSRRNGAYSHKQVFVNLSQPAIKLPFDQCNLSGGKATVGTMRDLSAE